MSAIRPWPRWPTGSRDTSLRSCAAFRARTLHDEPPAMTIPKTGMVLAAGLGTRMRPITDKIPKSLVQVHGRALLDHAIDRLEAVGAETIVVNTHYLGQQVIDHLA